MMSRVKRKGMFNQPGWEIWENQLQLIYNNADSSLKAIGCDKRDWYAGKCAVIDEIRNTANKFKDSFKVKKGS